MFQTIQVSSCVSVQGELVEQLPNGDAIVRDGAQHLSRPADRAAAAAPPGATSGAPRAAAALRPTR